LTSKVSLSTQLNPGSSIHLTPFIVPNCGLSRQHTPIIQNIPTNPARVIQFLVQKPKILLLIGWSLKVIDTQRFKHKMTRQAYIRRASTERASNPLTKHAHATDTATIYTDTPTISCLCIINTLFHLLLFTRQ
jgi:hypothetical protein